MSDTDTVGLMIRACDLAMASEGVSDAVRERVIRLLVYGDPEGPQARHVVDVDDQEKLPPAVMAAFAAMGQSIGDGLQQMADALRLPPG